MARVRLGSPLSEGSVVAYLPGEGGPSNLRMCPGQVVYVGWVRHHQLSYCLSDLTESAAHSPLPCHPPSFANSAFVQGTSRKKSSFAKQFVVEGAGRDGRVSGWFLVIRSESPAPNHPRAILEWLGLS